MPFHITFTDDPVEAEEAPAAYGRIQINTFEEGFLSSLAYWNRSRYEAQWKDGIERILNGADTSCLIVNMVDPLQANFILWWILYREGNDVHFQNAVLFIDELEGTFDENTPYRHIPARRTRSEEGLPISEWVTSVDDVARFLIALDHT